MPQPLAPLAFLWFTFAGDADCLRASLESIHRISPAATRHVRYDPEQPLPPDLIWECTQAGIDIRPSSGPHGGNLNGRDHLERQLDALADAAPAGGWIVKIDSDVVIQSMDWLMPVLSAPNPFGAVGFWANKPKPQPLCGPCYALRADVPRRLRQTLAAPPQALPFYEKMPEDHCVSTLLDATLEKGEIARIASWPQVPWFAGFQYQETFEDNAGVLDSYRTISIVTFGNRSMLTGTDAEKRAQTALQMWSLLAL